MSESIPVGSRKKKAPRDVPPLNATAIAAAASPPNQPSPLPKAQLAPLVGAHVKPQPQATPHVPDPLLPKLAEADARQARRAQGIPLAAEHSRRHSEATDTLTSSARGTGGVILPSTSRKNFYSNADEHPPPAHLQQPQVSLPAVNSPRLPVVGQEKGGVSPRAPQDSSALVARIAAQVGSGSNPHTEQLLASARNRSEQEREREKKAAKAKKKRQRKKGRAAAAAAVATDAEEGSDEDEAEEEYDEEEFDSESAAGSRIGSAAPSPGVKPLLLSGAAAAAAEETKNGDTTVAPTVRAPAASSPTAAAGVTRRMQAITITSPSSAKGKKAAAVAATTSVRRGAGGSARAKASPKNASVAKATALKRSPAASDAAAAAAASVEDTYEDNDWRNVTVKQLSSSSASDSVEQIRFTLLPQSIAGLYSGGSTPAAKRKHQNTSIEFCRSQRFGDTSRWVSVHSAQLTSPAVTARSGAGAKPKATPHPHPQAGVGAGAAFAPGASVFAMPCSTLCSSPDNPDEDVVVQLWQNDEDAAADGASGAAAPPPVASSHSSSFARTLLAEFTTSLRELTAQAVSDSSIDDFQRTMKSSGSPAVATVAAAAAAPRSALKAPLAPLGPGCTAGGSVPPRKNSSSNHVRFFDRVEIFNISARLDRTIQLPPSVVVVAVEEAEEVSEDGQTEETPSTEPPAPSPAAAAAAAAAAVEEKSNVATAATAAPTADATKRSARGQPAPKQPAVAAACNAGANAKKQAVPTAATQRGTARGQTAAKS